jgi:hypothetical protein
MAGKGFTKVADGGKPDLLLRFLRYWTRLYIPYFGCIFGDGAVAGELSRTRHIRTWR